MVKVIEIEDCWMIKEYNKHNSDKIKNDPDFPPGDVFMVYFLRFLLFCDQCHDFCEDAERNNWIHNVTGKGVIKKKIYDKIKDAYAEDIKHMQNDGGPSAIQLNSYGIGPDSIEKAWTSTNDMRVIIDKLLKDAFRIEVVGSSAGEAQDGCSMASKRLLQKVNLVPDTKLTNANSPYTIAVDADKSRFKLSTLLNFICDETLDNKINRNVKLYDMASTKYDSASGSGAINFIKAIKANYKNRDNISIEDDIVEAELKLTFKKFPLIHIKYEVDTSIGDMIDSKNWNDRRLKIMNDVKNSEANTELRYWPASNQIIYNSIKDKRFIIPYLKPGTSKDKQYEWKRNRITPGDLKNKIAKKSPSVKLNIFKFFSRDNAKFNLLNDVINSENSSVSNLTSNYDINNTMWKPEIGLGQDIGQDKQLNDLFNIMCYKTLGDFGQILEYKSLTDGARSNPKNLFITFDTICSRISSLFNRYTVFESHVIEEQGVTMFLPDYINTAILGVQKFFPDARERDAEAADELMNLSRATGSAPTDAPPSKKRKPSEFGKKSKVSIRNTSTRVLEAKLKLVGIPLSKVIRGKRVKLTRKQLEMKAETFKRLQIRCQKKGISLTYVSKKGRKYKSAKKLLSDLKRQPKPKMKMKMKMKMKWG